MYFYYGLHEHELLAFGFSFLTSLRFGVKKCISCPYSFYLPVSKNEKHDKRKTLIRMRSIHPTRPPHQCPAPVLYPFFKLSLAP
jgi:hypothetical protein